MRYKGVRFRIFINTVLSLCLLSVLNPRIMKQNRFKTRRAGLLIRSSDPPAAAATELLTLKIRTCLALNKVLDYMVLGGGGLTERSAY